MDGRLVKEDERRLVHCHLRGRSILGPARYFVSDAPAPELRIFISYRREDTSGYAGLLYETLTTLFGDANVFMDVDKLVLGLSFEEGIEKALASSDVLIAVIGRNWQGATDPRGQRRLDDPHDYVRREIESALARNLRVIPILAEGVSMPVAEDLPNGLKELPRRQALEMAYGKRWKYDCEILVDALEKARAEKVPSIQPSPEVGFRRTAEEHAKTADGSSIVGDGAATIDDRLRAAAEGANERRHATTALLTALRWRRWKRMAVFVCSLAVVAAAVISAVFLTRGSSITRGSSSAPPMASNEMSPDAIESELLLAHIPMKMRGSCKPARSPAPSVFLRTVDCAQDATGARATYSRAHASETLREYFRQLVAGKGVTLSTAIGCDKHKTAAGGWAREGLQTHIEGERSGREGNVLCWVTSDTAWIVWTDRPTKILGQASRPVVDRSALYEWWRSAAGPEKERAMSSSMSSLGTYPDAIEQELLLSHVPAAIRKSCKRADVSDELVFLRAITCRQEANGGPVTYSVAHSGSALKVYSDNRITAVGLAPPRRNQMFNPRQSCAEAEDAANYWSRIGAIGHRESAGQDAKGGQGAKGRVWCRSGNGTAWVEWTDAPTSLYAIASRDLSDRRGLYRWWRSHAGPGSNEGMGDMGAGMGG
jgi:hypothetical protein